MKVGVNPVLKIFFIKNKSYPMFEKKSLALLQMINHAKIQNVKYPTMDLSTAIHIVR